MGLLDQLMGQLGGDNASLLSLLQDLGGVGGIIDKFKAGGLGEIVESWVTSGQNLPVSAEQIESVLGNETISKIASALGIDTQNAADQLASSLPDLIDQITPNGQIPDGNSLLSTGLNLLKGKLGL